jgi:hypothetical protein
MGSAIHATHQPPVTMTPPTTKELVEKLEAWNYVILNSQFIPEGGEEPEESTILRATIAELKRGEEDAAILDFLDKHMLSLNHARASCSVYMDGTTVQGQVENVNRHRGGGSFTKVKGPSIRDAIRPAMSSTAAKEGEE